MSIYNDYSPDRVSGTIIAISSITILGALPLIGLSVVAKPAHPATLRTRIAWFLTGFATLLLIGSHITPLLTAIRWFIHREPVPVINNGRDLGPVAFALIGVTLIFEIGACRSVFYATLPLGITRKDKWTFIVLDMFSLGGLLGTLIGAILGTQSYESGMCGSPCTTARDVAAVFFNNTDTSGGMHITSVFSLIVVIAGAVRASNWSPHSPLARSIKFKLSILAVIQLIVTLLGVFIWVGIYNSESWDQWDYDPMYYLTIPFSWIQLVVLWFVQLTLRTNPTGALAFEGYHHDVELNEQPMERSEPTGTV